MEILEGETNKYCRWTVNGNFNMVEIPLNKSSTCGNMLLGNERMENRWKSTYHIM
jgi:hypothetical protein